MHCQKCDEDTKVFLDGHGHIVCSECGTPFQTIIFNRKTFKLKKSVAVVIPKEIAQIMGFKKKRHPISIHYQSGENQIVIKRDD